MKLFMINPFIAGLACRAGTMILALLMYISVVNAEPIVYVNDLWGQLGKVDVATGGVTMIGSMGTVMTDIAFDPSGNLWALSFSNFYRIDPTTGNATLVGGHSIPDGNALVFGQDGTLYAAGNYLTLLYTINTNTGLATAIGDIGFHSAGDLAFLGNDLYLTSTTDHLIRIGLGGTLNVTDVGPLGVSSVLGLARGDDGIMYGMAGRQILTINTSTGQATFLRNYNFDNLGVAYGASFISEATPEPSTISMLCIGAVGVLIYVRRRQKRATRN
jgi:hypothetical protein